MAAEKAFLLPVVIDDTHEGDARVPETSSTKYSGRGWVAGSRRPLSSSKCRTC
jgi:hypothetical protein